MTGSFFVPHFLGVADLDSLPPLCLLHPKYPQYVSFWAFLRLLLRVLPPPSFAASIAGCCGSAGLGSHCNGYCGLSVTGLDPGCDASPPLEWALLWGQYWASQSTEALVHGIEAH
jgi:hypothetical protein